MCQLNISLALLIHTYVHQTVNKSILLNTFLVNLSGFIRVSVLLPPPAAQTSTPEDEATLTLTHTPSPLRHLEQDLQAEEQLRDC